MLDQYLRNEIKRLILEDEEVRHVIFNEFKQPKKPITKANGGYLLINEAASFIGVKPTTLARHARNGVIKGHRPPGTKSWRFLLADLNNYMEQRPYLAQSPSSISPKDISSLLKTKVSPLKPKSSVF